MPYFPPSGGGSGDMLKATYDPASVNEQLVGLTASQNVTNKTTTTQAANDNSTKLATTAYVTTGINNAIAGVNPAVAVQAATNAILPNSPTYNNGASGVGAFITTLTTNVALVVDGYTPTLNQRVLVKNEASGGGLGAADNGVYFLSTPASLGVAWILTRALDYDTPSDMNNTGAIPVTNGSTWANTSWVQTSTVNTVGSDAVTFTQFSLNPTTIITNSTAAGGDLAGTYPNPTVVAATTSTAGKIQLAGDLSGTSAAPTVPAVDINLKVGSMTIIGHSYTAGTTQTDSGTSNVYQESLVAKTQGLLGIHEQNTTHLGMAGSYISQITNSSSHNFSGWAGAWQFILPSNSANVNATSDTVISDPVVAVNGAGLIIHGVNDINLGISGTAADDAVMATNNNNAGAHGYRSVISRMRSGSVYSSTVAAGSIAWDSTISFSGGSDVASVTQNTGPAYKTFNTNGNAFTIAIPSNFVGATIGINMVGQVNGVTHLSGNGGSITSGATSMKVLAHSMFPSSGTYVANIAAEGANTREEVLVTSGTGTNTWTITRAQNGTLASAHADNAVVSIATDTHNVAWSTNGSNGTITGTSAIGGQGTNNSVISITKRFVLTSADAGKTITGTVGGIVTGDTSAAVIFDSWQIEAPVQPPIVLTNLHHWEYGENLNSTVGKITAWNTAISNVVAEYDSWVQIADVYTPFQQRNGNLVGHGLTNVSASTTLNGGISSGATSLVVNANTNFPSSGAQQYYIKIAAEGANTTEYFLVTAGQGTNTWTVTPGALGSAQSAHANTAVVTLLVRWTANSSTYTPTVGTRMSFGQLGAEHSDVLTVLGSAPTWVLELNRGVGGTSLATHLTGAFMGPLQWMALDDIHLSTQGHGVYAQIIYAAFTSMPTPSTYQLAQNQGNWSQYSQSPAMGIVDNGWYTAPMNATTTGTTANGLQTAIPFYVPKMAIVTGMAAQAAASSSGIMRYGIYFPDATHSRPGRLIQDFGAYTYTSTTAWSTTGMYQVLRPGWYWLSTCQQTTAVSMRVVSGAASTTGLSWPFLSSQTAPVAGTGNPGIQGYRQTIASGNTPFVDWATYNEAGNAATGALVVYIQLRAVQFA